MNPRIWVPLSLGAVVLLLLLMSGSCVRQIPPSYVGIKFSGVSGISEKLVKPQVTWVGPLQRLIVYPTSIKNTSFVANSTEGRRQGDDAVRATTLEGETLPVDITVTWHVDPADVVTAFENFGTEDLSEIEDVFIRSIATYGVNTVSGQKSIFDLTSKERASFGPDVKKKIAPILAQFGITVDDVFLGEVFPSEEITSKINERISKRNELEKASIGLEQAKVDAQTILTNARRQAELNRQLALQGDKAITIRRLENQKAAIDAWDGNPASVGDGTIPFTSISPLTR